MDQPHLLELAKQGNSTAIAALMNAVLTPQEIQAQVGLEARCLCILLEANKALSQEVLVKFVSRGLLRLETDSIDSVQVYSRKTGESSFSWVRKFELKPIAPSSLGNPVSLEVPDERVSGDRSDLDSNNHDLEVDEAEFEAEQAESGALIPTYFRAYSVLFAFSIVVGFMSGGMIATFISTSQAENQTTAEADRRLDESLRKQTPQEKQQKAESYLKAMNVAQANFYRENKRFASSLEELERSTSLIFQSYDYAYRLKVANASRTEIAAVPKEAGLRSYVGVVAVTQSRPNGIICKTKKPSVESLPTPEFSKTLRCPSRSSQVN
ncbi:MAG: type IV pilin-like G/H family protein [Phormidesmis sp. CAN_BIN36]|nr:type IV pilin-like G/H family protein [Phormidesmis sp. CAN_BIN36]